MKTIRIKFVGFWPNPDVEDFLFTKILRKHYDVQICEDPDYVICSCFQPLYAYCEYPQVRILLSHENFGPDFNLFDYSITPYPVSFGDRCFYKPCGDTENCCLSLEVRPKVNRDAISEKQYFASFIASHDSEYNLRSAFFNQLCRYKRVESAGTFLNNMPGQIPVTYQWESRSKFELQSKCKFALCFESTKHDGFITEKIVHAFYSNSVPIYLGSPTVEEIFNPKAFINLDSFTSFDECIGYIEEVDNNDELYLSILNEPVLNDPKFFSTLYESFEAYLLHIFDQPLDEAYRRSRVYAPKIHNDYLLDLQRNDIRGMSGKAILKRLARKILK